MKTDADRGPIGAWARRTRIAAGYTSADKAARDAQAAGIEMTTAYLRGIESGAHKPSRDVVIRLAALYGVTPPTVESESDRLAEMIRQGTYPQPVTGSWHSA